MRRNQQVVHVQPAKYQYGLFECTENGQTCIYVWCCTPCAVADLSIVTNCMSSPLLQWILIIFAIPLAIVIASVIGCVAGAEPSAELANGLMQLANLLVVVLVYSAANVIATKLGFQIDTGCCCCLEYYFCWGCKICQIANQLYHVNGYQSPEAVELVTQINETTPFKECLVRIYQ
jgi:hypothetical protein